jgi:hypothetical protein
MKATEIRLSSPIVTAASPVVHTEPITRVMRSAQIRRPERMPSTRLMATRMKESTLA